MTRLLGRVNLANSLSEELPVRLAHRIKELDQLPHDLNAMPSINKVKDWYAQSFEVCRHYFSPLECQLTSSLLGAHHIPSDKLAPEGSASPHGPPL